MELLKDVEKKILELSEGLPKLPQGLIDFLAEWAWLLSAISAGLGALALLTIISVGFIGTFALFALGVGFYSLFLTVTLLAGFAGIAASVYLNFIAIKPLKAMLYKGWQLMLLANLVNFVFSVVYKIGDGDFTGIVSTLIFTALGLYVLSQTRDKFTLGSPVEEIE